MTIAFSLLASGFWLIPNAFSQTITKSFSEKVPGKFTDYEILGKNDWGTILHYFGSSEHEFAVYDDDLRVVNRRSIPMEDKNVVLTDIIVQRDLVRFFYTQQTSTALYFKVRSLDRNLSLQPDIRVIDSVGLSAEERQKYYVKVSPDQSKLVAFMILKKKDYVFVRFFILNQALEVIGKNMFTVSNDADATVKSVKVNNNGHVVCVFGHKARWPNDDYEFERYTVMLYNRESKTITESSIASTGLLYKSLVTEVSSSNDLVYVSMAYKNNEDKADIGFSVQAYDLRSATSILDQKLPLTESDVLQSKTFDFKTWQDKVSIIKPRRLVPRSDGGFLLIGEGEFKYTKVDRVQPLSYNYMYMPDQNVRYTDQNHYYDIFVYSLNRDGTVDWKANMPKSQISENDDGYYSSFACLEANNVLKFYYNEDILSTGNFVEYNVNPSGKTKRVSLLNSEKEEVVLIPQKARQVDGRTVIIPSEQKRVLQLIKFAY